MNIEFAIITWPGFYGGYKYVIPLNESAPLKNKGVIEQWKIDDYENGCWHVKPVNTEYATPDGERIIPSSTHWTTDAYWGENYFPKIMSEGVGSYHAWEQREDSTCVYTYRGGRIAMWKTETPSDTPPDDVCGLERVEGWLENHGYDLWWTKPIKLPTTVVVKTASPAFIPLNKLTASAIVDQFLMEHPLEPDLSSEYFALCAQLKCNSNNLENLASIASAVKSLMNCRQTALSYVNRTVSKAAADAWLAYRYTYCTTKADIEEAARCAEALSRDRGILRSAIDIRGAEARLKVVYYPYENQMYQSLLEASSVLQRLGLDPSLVNTWDSIPFSFIADWFLPIGDNLQRMADAKWAATMPYQVDSIASIKGTTSWGGREYQVYTRFDYTPSYDLEWISDDGTSYTTWTKRVMDVVSLTR